jgi:hypothetical protein
VANPGTAWHVRGTGDFYGDGNTDILFQNQSGVVALWDMNGSSITQGGQVMADPGAAWQVKGTGDLYGDGKTDIVLQNQDGSVAIWEMNGTTITQAGEVQFDDSTANPGTGWQVVGTGDLYGDGKTDIVLQNQDGSVAIWKMNGTTIISAAEITVNPGPTWHVVDAGNFSNDGKADIVLQNDNGSVAVWEMNGSTISGGGIVANPGASWNLVGNDRMQFISGASGNAPLIASALMPTEFTFTNFAAGSHTISGFDPRQDIIELNKAQFANFSAVQAATASSGSGALITLNGFSSLLLQGVNPASLHASNFALA